MSPMRQMLVGVGVFSVMFATAKLWPNKNKRTRRQHTKREAQVYTLRGRNNRINYVGSTNDPARRAKEHQQAGKHGKLVVETPKMSRAAAQQREAKRLADYRKRHQGKNPKYNRTRNGDWRS